MGKRAIDLCFAPNEKLWRSVSADQIDRATDGVKPTAIRLQVSVARGAKCAMQDAKNPSVPPKFNGLAEVHAKDARGQFTANIEAVCIDEPTDFEPHALIAFTSVADVGSISDEEMFDAKVKLAGRMKVVKKPTK